MLVLSRRIDEQIVLQVGDKLITVDVVDIRRKTKCVRLGFTADSDVVIHRREVFNAILREGAINQAPPEINGIQ
jgi:carbon storage regulator